METREYRTIDKSDWGDGPWQQEPDKKQWQDAETGLPCLIVRGPNGSLCGYVGVSDGHPAFEKNYDDVDVEVHGGLTFCDHCGPGDNEASGICHVPPAGEPDHVWWLGFDCAHIWDFSPGRPLGFIRFSRDETYRDLAYVENECRSLARQLAAQRTT